MDKLTHGLCDLLAWDSEFFGFRIGRIQDDTLNPEKVAEIDVWCRQHEIRCLYFLARLDDSLTTQLAEKNNYHLADIRMTLDWRNSTNSKWNNPVLLRRAQADDVPILREIARKSHYDSRFFYDNRFPIQLSEALYQTWITRSIEGYADCVLVAVSEENFAIGYISCHLDGNPPIGRIGLFGVQADKIGRGIGQSLVKGALNWFDAEGAQRKTVVTQARNYAAQRLYQRCGFMTENVQIWYHKWYPINVAHHG